MAERGKSQTGGGRRPNVRFGPKAKEKFKAATPGLETVVFGYGATYTPDTFQKAYHSLTKYVGAGNLDKKGGPEAAKALRKFSPPEFKTPKLRGDEEKAIAEYLYMKEIENCKNGLPSGIWLKCNSLVDHRLIELLYEASQAGVPIEILARGICCLRPGVAGLSETITVRSIIGRFLEHGRIYVFANGGEFLSDKNIVMISSADLMPRNLRRRVECFMRLENPTIRKQVLHQIMVALLRDEKNSWYLQPDGSYVHLQTDETSFSCHEYFMSNPSLSGLGSLAGAQDNG